MCSNIEIKGNIDHIKIPPLLLLPFIENCFKHASKNNEKVKLNISFENKKNKQLVFKSKNNFNVNNTSDKKHGIGINNVRRRLDLLYRNKYILETNVIDNTFNVLLKIPLV